MLILIDPPAFKRYALSFRSRITILSQVPERISSSVAFRVSHSAPVIVCVMCRGGTDASLRTGSRCFHHFRVF